MYLNRSESHAFCFHRLHAGANDLPEARQGPVSLRSLNGSLKNTHIGSYIHSIDPRRIVVVDERMGIVVGMFMFNHPGKVLFADVPGGRLRLPAIRSEDRVGGRREISSG